MREIHKLVRRPATTARASGSSPTDEPRTLNPSQGWSRMIPVLGPCREASHGSFHVAGACRRGESIFSRAAYSPANKVSNLPDSHTRICKAQRYRTRFQPCPFKRLCAFEYRLLCHGSDIDGVASGTLVTLVMPDGVAAFSPANVSLRDFHFCKANGPHAFCWPLHSTALCIRDIAWPAKAAILTASHLSTWSPW